MEDVIYLDGVETVVGVEFKVGDWITFIDIVDKNPKQIIRIQDGIAFTLNNKCLLSQCNPWAPKEGEFCWFWNEDDKVAKFGRYKESINLSGKCNFFGKYRKAVSYDARWFKYSQEDYTDPGSSSYFCEYDEFDFCEPFIGELPSNLKEQ